MYRLDIAQELLKLPVIESAAPDEIYCCCSNFQQIFQIDALGNQGLLVHNAMERHQLRISEVFHLLAQSANKSTYSA